VEDSLSGRQIAVGDVLIYDQARTDEARPWIVARVCRLVDGWPEYHATVPGYPILNGERKVYGTLAAVVRCTDGKEGGR